MNIKKLFLFLILSVALLGLTGCLNDKVKFEVNNASCNGCNKCVVKCPVNAITVIDGKAFIDTTNCIGCGICADICPRDAIN